MKAQGISDFQAPPPNPKFIDTALGIDELPSYDSFEPCPDDFYTPLLSRRIRRRVICPLFFATYLTPLLSDWPLGIRP